FALLRFLFNHLATSELYTLSLHDALPISLGIQLMVFFEWYVGLQRLHLEDVIAYKTKTWKEVWEEAAPLRKKMRRQVLKDYVFLDRKSTRLNSSHVKISYAVFCLKKKKKK